MKNILKHPLKLSKKSAVLLGLAVFALSTSSVSAQAQCLQSTTWRGSTGSWFTPANWTNGVPSSITQASINNGGTAQVNNANLIANACTLTLGQNAGNSGTVLLDASAGGGTLTVADFVIVGSSGSGTLQYNVIPAASGTVNARTATLGTHSNLKVVLTGTFTPGARYTLLTADHGVSGTFANVTIVRPPPPPCYNPQIHYDANHVYLDLVVCSD
jgi:hypothetical protein